MIPSGYALGTHERKSVKTSLNLGRYLVWPGAMSTLSHHISHGLMCRCRVSANAGARQQAWEKGVVQQ